MLIWVNGPFGGGKTTLAAELRKHWDDALVFDPEEVGLLLTAIVDCPTRNFQDIPLWRSQVTSLAVGLYQQYGRRILVPMNLVEAAYAREIFGALREAAVPFLHFCLKVPAEVLSQRLLERRRAHR